MDLKQNALRTYIAHGVNVVIWFFGSILLSRLLGVEGRGQYIVFITTSQFLNTLLPISIWSSIQYFTSSGKINIEAQKFMIFVIGGITLILAPVILYLFSITRFNEYLFIRDLGIDKQILFLTLLYFFNFIFMSITSIFKGMNMFKQANLSLNFSSFILLVAYGILFVANKFYFINISIKTFLLVFTIASSFQLLVPIYYTYKNKLNIFKIKNPHGLQFKAFLQYSVLAFIASIIGFIWMKLDFWFISGYMKSDSLLGLYSLALNLNLPITMISTTISSVLLTHLGRSKGKITNEQFVKLSNMLFFTAVFLSILVFISFYFLITIIYGKDFSFTAQIFGFLLPGTIIGVLISPVVSFNYASREIKKIIFFYGVGMFSSFCLIIVFIEKFGLKAIVFSFIFSKAIALIVGYSLIWKDIKHQFIKIFSLRGYISNIKSVLGKSFITLKRK